MKKLILIFLFAPFLLFAQEKGVHFEHTLNWEKTKEMAKAQNKYIFVDCFTTWCAPCKYMSTTIFPQEKIGKFFNANFINLKLQMDQTKTDSEEVKTWYAEAKRFEKDYEVIAYPTFLIFNPEGEWVHTITGADNTDGFIAKAKLALDPETQQVTMQRKFESAPLDTALALKVCNLALELNKGKLFQRAFDRYLALAGADSLLTSKNFDILLSAAYSTTDTAYKIIAKNKSIADQRIFPFYLNRRLESIVFNEKIKPLLNGDQQIDFVALQQKLVNEHPEVDMTAALFNAKSTYYANRKDWPAFVANANEALASNNEELSGLSSVNSFARMVFLHFNDSVCLQKALTWSKKTIEEEEKAIYMDTYANLLYKSGDRKAAILWKKKAIEKAAPQNKADYLTALKKMSKGIPTWETTDKN